MKKKNNKEDNQNFGKWKFVWQQSFGTYKPCHFLHKLFKIEWDKETLLNIFPLVHVKHQPWTQNALNTSHWAAVQKFSMPSNVCGVYRSISQTRKLTTNKFFSHNIIFTEEFLLLNKKNVLVWRKADHAMRQYHFQFLYGLKKKA